MNKCNNCRFKNKDFTSKTCIEYLQRSYDYPSTAYCLNWKKEHWWQAIIRKTRR